MIQALSRVEYSTRDGTIDRINICLRELRETRARVKEGDILVLARNGLAVHIQAIHEQKPRGRGKRWQFRRVQDRAEVRVCLTEREDTAVRQARGLGAG